MSNNATRGRLLAQQPLSNRGTSRPRDSDDESQERQGTRKRRRDGSPSRVSDSQIHRHDEEEVTNFKLVTRFRPLLCVDYLDAGELLVVERPLVDVLRELPPAFFKPKYGS